MLILLLFSLLSCLITVYSGGCELISLSQISNMNTVNTTTLTDYLIQEKLSLPPCGVNYDWSKIKALKINNQDLSHGIGVFQKPLYSNMDRLHVLEIKNSNLPFIPNDILTPFKSLKSLDLTGNGYIGYPYNFFDTFININTQSEIKVDNCALPCQPGSNSPCGMEIYTGDNIIPGMCITRYMPCVYLDTCTDVTVTFLTSCISTQVSHSNYNEPNSLGGNIDNTYYNVVCNSGYYMIGDSQSYCSATGMIVPQCLPIPNYCSSLNYMDNGLINCLSATEGTKCQYQCYNGYYKVSKYAICSPNYYDNSYGNWTNYQCSDNQDNMIDMCSLTGNIQCLYGGDLGSYCVVDGYDYKCICSPGSPFVWNSFLGTCTYNNTDYCFGNLKCSERGDTDTMCISHTNGYSCLCGDNYSFDGITCEQKDIAIPYISPYTTQSPITTDHPVYVGDTIFSEGNVYNDEDFLILVGLCLFFL